jgi:signal transduction histidine kinase
MSCRASVAGSPKVVGAVEAATGVAARNARLRAALREEARELSASRRRLLTVVDEQRLGLGMRLDAAVTGPRAQLADALRELDASTAGTSGDHGADETRLMADRALAEAVGRCRAIAKTLESDLDALAGGLGPVSLRGRGLAEALSDLTRGLDPSAHLAVDADGLPMELVATVYLLCAEAVTNVVKHADATRLELTCEHRDGVLQLRVADDGRGGADASRGSGLKGLAERSGVFGGTVDILSPAGGGTVVTIRLPTRARGLDKHQPV